MRQFVTRHYATFSPRPFVVIILAHTITLSYKKHVVILLKFYCAKACEMDGYQPPPAGLFVILPSTANAHPLNEPSDSLNLVRKRRNKYLAIDLLVSY